MNYSPKNSVIAALGVACLLTNLLKAEDQAAMLATATKRALKYAAPAVVKIQTVGGRERIGESIVATGPTTGLIVDEGGFIVSSAFNFKHDPATILVSLPNGQDVAAKIIGRDKSRMLVLLRVEVDERLPILETVPATECRPGQFALAMGRTYDSQLPNVSLGIVSATDRIWGKAIQTDCKVSPANYGGPLTDLRGRVIGLLVPLSVQDSSEMAGAEHYDGGIGFAIPIGDIERMLPALRKGETIFPGLLGVTLKGSDLYHPGPLEIAYCPIKSPAAKAGLKKGDRLVQINDQTIHSQSEMKHILGPLIAGETIKVTALRGDRDKKIQVSVELAAKIDPYILPTLGVLPTTWGDEHSAKGIGKISGDGGNPAGPAAAPNSEAENAAVVGYVFPDSPAKLAGLQPGDRLLKWDDSAIATTSRWREAIAISDIDQPHTLAFQRGEKEQTTQVLLKSATVTAPGNIPIPSAIEDSPPSQGKENDRLNAKEEAEEDDNDATLESLKLPEEPNACYVCLPEQHDASVSHGVVVWIDPPGNFDEKKFAKKWQPLCDQYRLIVMAPRPQDKRRWQRGEIQVLRKQYDKLASRYAIDRNRVVAMGEGVGGAMAFGFAFDNRDIVRGIGPINTSIPLGITTRGNGPYDRLEVYAIGCTKDKVHDRLKQNLEKLKELGFPVHAKWIDGATRKMRATELDELARWTLTLNRL